MSVGAVLYRTGTAKSSQLGGLYKTMPYTMISCVIGAASISAFPLFSGFISKSMILSAVAKDGYMITWLLLLFASAGVLHHSGIKIPYFTFFANDSGKRPAEAPWNMLLAMGITAFLCIAIGVWPNALYGILPFEVELQSLHLFTYNCAVAIAVFLCLAFATLMRAKIYPRDELGINLESDWILSQTVPWRIRLYAQTGCCCLWWANWCSAGIDLSFGEFSI